MKLIKFNKRGLSPVIATVLLILIVLVIIGILAIFLLPGLTENAQERAACFEAINKINFDDSGYNCYYSTNDGKKGTAFAVNIRSPDILGFRVGLIAGGTSDTFEVKNGTVSSQLRMYDRIFGDPLEVVNDGGVRTYIANKVYKKIDLFPIISFNGGYVCKTTRKSLNLGQCLDADIKKNIDDGDTNLCNGEGIDVGEECDGTDFGTETCQTKGFDNGNLACTNECKINIDDCFNDEPSCGDDICNNGETCSTCAGDCGICGAECTLTSASWDKASVYEGESVTLTVGGQSCDTKTISFDIVERDWANDNDVPNNLQASFANGKFEATWVAEWQDDDGIIESNPPDYYFKGSLGNDKSPESGRLQVLACGDDEINGLVEVCDGSDLGGQTCQSLDPIKFNGGTLGCYARGAQGGKQCTFDTSACTSPDKCSDNDKICSLGDSQVCKMPNGYSGTQTCNAYCSGWGDCSTNLFCGDGICTNPPENNKFCLQDCNICGDGKKYGNEQCDDGDQIDNNACSNSCKITYCGDNTVNIGEECDDGNLNNNDACINSCKNAKCPDGYVWNGNEQCDDGDQIDNNACSNSCKINGGSPQCGNGKFEPGPPPNGNNELCDDGNEVDNDGCTGCKVDGNKDDGSDWFCSGSVGSQSLCCDRSTGECSDLDGGEFGYYDNQKNEKSCDEGGAQTCADVFGGLLGWKSADFVDCSLNLDICTAWQVECTNKPPSDCEMGQVYGYSTKTCCYEQGICQVLWYECTCTGV